ncbi:MAG TPA: TPM domain-containing protein [Thermoanaerobaculia bacterium]|nr:TPM domain-containing protein [Thermoanaerobaculia bacterium]
MNKKELLDHIDKEAIVTAIERAEKLCSGEIRVHIEPGLHKREIWDVAKKTFERMGMTRTAQRNGVLLFIASKEQQFVILGDREIDERVEPGFWDHLASDLAEHFRRGEFTEGIVQMIEESGARLQQYFPFQRGDLNELPNQVSIGDAPDENADDRER